MQLRFGKIDKFVLYNLYSADRHSNGRQKKVDRSQIIYSFYSVISAQYENHYKYFVSKHIDIKLYERLQVSITRSTKKLEKYGYITRSCASHFNNTKNPSQRRVTLSRKFSFAITALGKIKILEILERENMSGYPIGRRTARVLLKMPLPDNN